MSSIEAPPTRLMTLSYLMAIVAVHFFFVSYSMSLVQVPRLLVGEPSWLVGLVVGSLGIAGMVTRPLTGRLVDRGSRQRWVRLGAVLTAIGFAGYALQAGPWVTLLFRLVHGVSMGFFTTALLAIVGSRLPVDRRGLGVGVYQSANAMAGLYGAASAVAIMNVAGFEVSFAVAGGCALLALVFGAFAGDAPAQPPRTGAAPRTRLWALSPTAIMPALVFLAVTTPWGAVNAFLPLYADERSLGNPGLFYTVVAMAQLATRAGAGMNSDRFGRGAVIVPALIIATGGMVILASAQSQFALLAAAACYGVGIAATQTAIVALIVDRTPARELGMGMATYTIAWDVGAVLGSIGLGLVANATSYGFVFALAAVSPLLGLVVFFARVRVRAPRAAGSRAAS